MRKRAGLGSGAAGLALVLVATLPAPVSVFESPASAASQASGSPATTPPNNAAYVFDTFGSDASLTSANSEATRILKAEAYGVTSFVDPNPGGTDTPGTTIDQFVAMAGAGVVVIDTHGLAPSPTNPGGLAVEVYRDKASAIARGGCLVRC